MGGVLHVDAVGVEKLVSAVIGSADRHIQAVAPLLQTYGDLAAIGEENLEYGGFLAGILHPYDADNNVAVALRPLELNRPLTVRFPRDDLRGVGNSDFCQ